MNAYKHFKKIWGIICVFCRRVKKECIDTIIGKSYVGDWFLFYLLGQNIDSVIFKVRLLVELGSEIISFIFQG